MQIGLPLDMDLNRLPGVLNRAYIVHYLFMSTHISV